MGKLTAARQLRRNGHLRLGGGKLLALLALGSGVATLAIEPKATAKPVSAVVASRAKIPAPAPVPVKVADALADDMDGLRAAAVIVTRDHPGADFAREVKAIASRCFSSCGRLTPANADRGQRSSDSAWQVARISQRKVGYLNYCHIFLQGRAVYFVAPGGFLSFHTISYWPINPSFLHYK